MRKFGKAWRRPKFPFKERPFYASHGLAPERDQRKGPPRKPRKIIVYYKTPFHSQKSHFLSRFYGGFDILFIIHGYYNQWTRRLGGGFLRRGRFEIIGEILSLAKEGARKTSIVYRANLNFNVVNKYLTLLAQEGLISPDEGSGELKTTEKGLLFLKAYKNFKGVAKNL